LNKIKHWLLIISAAFFFAVIFCVPANAVYVSPTGGTVYGNLASGSDLNKTIYVYCKDNYGNTLKNFVYKTKVMDYDVFGISMYGYDLIGYSSNQGIGESCKLTWASSNGSTAGYAQIGYQFYTLISKSSLTINLTFKKHESTKFYIYHYTVDQNGNTVLNSYSTETHSYGDSLYISAKSIYGYTLDSDYKATISGNFTYNILGSCENVDSRLYYNYHEGSRQGDMYDRNSYSYSSSDYISYCSDRVIKIYFYYNQNTYSVTYNANGGTGAPASQTKIHDISLTLSSIQPTRNGYTFIGWGTYSTDTAPDYYPGETYTGNAGLTLYAIWQSNSPVTYTVSYNANGGTGAPASQTKTYGVTLTLSSVTPSRSGYTFLGWSTSSTASSPTYYPGGSYAANASATLYAVWLYNSPATYTVSYNANGGYGAPASQTKTYGVTLTLSSVTPSRSGYTFLGWSTSSMATSPTYSPGGSYTANASATLYAVWSYNGSSVTTYTVSYNANGGYGAPASQTKTYGVTLTLSSVTPSRSGYTFLGWSISSAASSPTYYPGGSYTANASATLYAVWSSEANYDLSVSSVTPSDTDPEADSDITVSVRLDSWDGYNAYTDIPVDLVYNGTVVSTEYISLSAYGIEYLTFSLNVGSAAGENTITVRINWADRYDETNSDNNSMSVSIDVKTAAATEYDLYPDAITANAGYREGTEVITSFLVYNDSAADILPDDGCTVSFTAYYYTGPAITVIDTQEWDNFVVPANGSNLVYFKWAVPEGLAGITVICRIDVSADGDSDLTNNSSTLQNTIISKLDSQPGDTYYGTAPDDFTVTTAPDTADGTATWSMCVYENGSLVEKNYGICLTASNPVLTPDADVSTALQDGYSWTIKSGYGVEISFAPYVYALDGYSTAPSSAYTAAQTAYALFPEFGYSSEEGYCAVLEDMAGIFSFISNSASSTGARVHYIPVWMPDGDYTISATATDCWTPAGMISTTKNSSDVTISGTMYEDWFIGN
jgi:uncharacterized repeat protein (TIGR02543 family)